MGRLLVQTGDNQYAIFSTIVDDIIAKDLSRDDVIDFCVEEAAERAREDANRWLSGRSPGRSIWTPEEIVDKIRSTHGNALADIRKRELGA